jgi:hypothetical protein
VYGDYGESDDTADSNESLEELFVMERTVNRLPNAGDDTDDDETEDANEEAGLAHALATRTPGPKMRRGEVDPLHFGMGTGAGMKEMGMGEGLENIEGDSVGFVDWSGSN